MRSRVVLISSLLCVGIGSALAEPRSTTSKAPLIVNGREVMALIVTGPIRVGAPLPPGAPTVPLYTVRPNRLSPVREDSTGVYFQADGGFAEGSSGLGGLFVSRTSIDEIYAYRGDGRYAKIYLPFVGRVQAADLAKVRIQFRPEQKRK